MFETEPTQLTWGDVIWWARASPKNSLWWADQPLWDAIWVEAGKCARFFGNEPPMYRFPVIGVSNGVSIIQQRAIQAFVDAGHVQWAQALEVTMEVLLKTKANQLVASYGGD